MQKSGHEGVTAESGTGGICDICVRIFTPLFCLRPAVAFAAATIHFTASVPRSRLDALFDVIVSTIEVTIIGLLVTRISYGLYRWLKPDALKTPQTFFWLAAVFPCLIFLTTISKYFLESDYIISIISEYFYEPVIDRWPFSVSEFRFGERLREFDSAMATAGAYSVYWIVCCGLAYSGYLLRTKQARALGQFGCKAATGAFAIFLIHNLYPVIEISVIKIRGFSGNGHAQFYLGDYYSNSNGRGADEPLKAIEWYRKAAEQGDSDAMERIADLYNKGSGELKPDRNEAAKWFGEAARYGDRQVACRIGNIYWHDAPDELRDAAKSYFWYRICGRETRMIQEVSLKLTTEKISDLNKQIEEWFANRPSLAYHSLTGQYDPF